MHEHPLTGTDTQTDTTVANIITLSQSGSVPNALWHHYFYLIFSPHSLTELLTTINPLSLVI